MKEGIKFTIRELSGVYVKRLSKVYEVDYQGDEYYVPGLAENLAERVWNVELTEPKDTIVGYRSKSDIKGGIL